MIVFDKVTKKFGQITALEDVSFKVDKGEFVFLTGASGAGKSSVIKLITGEYSPSEGVIEVNGERLDRKKRRRLHLWRRRFGVVFQDYKLFGNRTVAENVSLPLQIQGIPAGEIKEKVEKILHLVGLTERADLFPAQLAGGELQRTSLARAVITGPEILLADEPTGNLDPETAREMVELFQEINQNGTTILMATHNCEIVDVLKARVIELEKGRVVRDEKEGKYHCQKPKEKAKETKEPKEHKEAGEEKEEKEEKETKE